MSRAFPSTVGKSESIVSLVLQDERERRERREDTLLHLVRDRGFLAARDLSAGTYSTVRRVCGLLGGQNL